MLSRRTILLKPMQPALSGYARLQSENGSILVQLHARGLEEGRARLFAYLKGQAAKEIGSAQINANGEFSLQAEAPRELEALLLIDSRPLLIGLCRAQDGGSLMDAKNAALALCERLAPSKKQAAEPDVQPPAVKPVSARPARAASSSLPREIFLPAIDPAPYAKASARAPKEPVLPPPKPTGPPADRLRPLRWPRGFEAVRAYFETCMPCAPFELPGWRFVRAADGLCIGMLAMDGRVRRIAYACRGNTPPPMPGKYHPLKGRDGMWYQVLWMEV